MLAGGGPVITTDTGGIGEAVGDCAIIVPIDDPAAIASALDRVSAMTCDEWDAMERSAREHALRFDRVAVFDHILDRLDDDRLNDDRIGPQDFVGFSTA